MSSIPNLALLVLSKTFFDKSEKLKAALLRLKNTK